MNTYLEYYHDMNNPQLSKYTYGIIEGKLDEFITTERLMPEKENYIAEIFCIIKTPNGIFTPNDLQFNTFFCNNTYTKDFWINQINENFYFKFYPADDFYDFSVLATKRKNYLMPVAFKTAITKGKSNFIMAALINVDLLMKTARSGFTEDLYVFTKDNDLLFPMDINREIITEELINSGNSLTQIEDGYIFIQEGNTTGLKYIKFYSIVHIEEQMNRISSVVKLIILCSVALSALIAIYIVKRINNPVRQIVELIKMQEKNPEFSISSDFKSIASNIKSLIEKNCSYEKNISKKDSLLQRFSYQVKMLDIFVDSSASIEELGNLGNFKDYVVIYFKAHYKSSFYNHIFESKGKGTFFLRELIENYVDEYFDDSITFQVGSDQIVSVVSVESMIKDVHDTVNEIIKRLETEEDFVFFTVACTKKYRDITELKNAYNRVMEMADHRILTTGNQLITEETLVHEQNSYYFTKEQQDQFVNLVQNGKMEESIKLITEILEFNFKKDVNNFYMKLLCNKIVSCCSTIFMELYNRIPNRIKLADTYASFNQCTTIEDYKVACLNFLSVCVNYINAYRKENDYIVDYIKDYVDKNYEKEIFLDLLSEKLNISKTYLSSYFKEKTGMNFVDYLNSYRIRKATKLLEDSSTMIKDVAIKVGIPNIRSFNRSFKKYTGKSPNEYRRSLS